MRMIIEGMMCPKCVARVEKALSAIGGITVQVDLQGATITGEADAQTLIDAVQTAGYTFVRFE